jgi:hypothetical protein
MTDIVPAQANMSEILGISSTASDTRKPRQSRRHPGTLASREVQAALSLFAMPTAAPARLALACLGAGQFEAVQGACRIMAERDGVQTVVECDNDIGFSPEYAIRRLASRGPGVVQTFGAMVGVWLAQADGAPYDRKIERTAKDLLRAKGRRELPRSGYRAEDVLQCGEDVYTLMVTTVPRASTVERYRGRVVRRSLQISRLVEVETIDAQLALYTGAAGRGAQAVVKFRYHLGREIYDWLAGDDGEFFTMAGRLLRYHPDRQRYHILLGVAMAGVARSRGSRAEHELPLPDLLDLAALDPPARNASRLLYVQIGTAIEDLARDGVIPGAQLHLADRRAALSGRQAIEKAWVTFGAAASI